MKICAKKRVAVVLSFLIVIFLSSYIALNRTGFCYERGYFPGGYEIIYSGVYREINSRNFGDEIISTPEEFIEKFPDCCSLEEEYSPFEIVRFLSPFVYAVRITYLGRESVIIADSCGEIWQRYTTLTSN